MIDWLIVWYYMYRIEYRYKSPKFCLRFFPLNKVKKKYFIFLLDVKKESTLTGHGFSNSLYCTTSPISHIKCGHQWFFFFFFFFFWYHAYNYGCCMFGVYINKYAKKKFPSMLMVLSLYIEFIINKSWPLKLIIGYIDQFLERIFNAL